MSYWLELNHMITYNYNKSREINYLAMSSRNIMISLD